MAIFDLYGISDEDLELLKPSEICKSAGLKSLKELSRISKESEQHLINLAKRKPRTFLLMAKGAAVLRKEAIDRDQPFLPSE